MRFCARLKLFNGLGAFFCNSVARKEAWVRWGRPQVGGAPLKFNNVIMFLLSRFFLPIQIKRRAGAFCRAGPGFCAPISTDVVRPRASIWRTRRSVIPPRLMRVHEPRSGPDISARDLQENNVRALARTRFEPYLNGRAPALRSCGISRRQPVSSLSFGSPFSRRNGRSSALIGAPPSSDRENITRTIAACQDNSSIATGDHDIGRPRHRSKRP